MTVLETRVRLWTVAALVAIGTSGMAIIRSFAGQAGTLPGRWSVFATWAVGATLAVGTLLLLLLVILWNRLDERHFLMAVVALGCLLVIAPATAKTVGRLRLGSKRMVLDAVLQVEVAAGMLTQGRNPYRENYLGTELEEWHGSRDRFPLYHLVYPPVPLFLTVPARSVCLFLFGVYDSRFLLLPAWIGSFYLAFRAWRGNPWRTFLLATAFLNPQILSDLHVGRWDTLVLFLWVLALLAWARGHPLGAAGLLGLMAGVKQTFALAGIFCALAIVSDRRQAQRWVSTWGIAILFPLLPFLLWDAPAIWESLVTAPLGLAGYQPRVIDAGPYGGGWLRTLMGGNAPAWAVQMPATLAVAVMSGREVWARRTPASLGLATTATLATFFYFGSYSDPSYFGFLLSMTVAGFGFNQVFIKAASAGVPAAEAPRLNG